MSMQNPDLYGVSRIRSGIKLYLIAIALTVVSVIAFVATLFASFQTAASSAISTTSSPSGILAAYGSAIIALIALVIVVAVLEFISLLRVRDGFSTLVSIGRDVGSGKTGTTIIFVAIVLEVIGAVTLIVGVGIVLMIVAGILFGVGTILLGLGFRQLGTIYNNSTTRTGGTLFLVGAILIFIPGADIVGYILVLVGLILLYKGLGQVEQSLSSGIAPPSPGTLAVTYQQQQNVIRASGVAYVSVYSPVQVSVLRAEIQGTQYSTTNVVPNTLVVGQNNLTINFNVPLSLTPGSTYIIRLYLSNGTTQDVSAVFLQ